MTIASTLTSQQLPCNGTATQFSFNNKIFLPTDLIVTLIDTLGNLYAFTNGGSGLVFSNGATGLSYTLFNVDVDAGCYIVFSAPPTNGWTCDMRTDTTDLQTTSIKNQGAFLPELHEETFDRLTREVQDLERITYSFGIHGPDIEATPWPALPNAAARANSSLGFGPTGLPTIQPILPGALSQAAFNALFIAAPPYAATAAETAAGVVGSIINYSRFPSPWKDISRYVSDNTGVTDVAAQFAAAIAAESHVIIPDGLYRFKSQVNVNKSNITIEGTGRAGPSSQGRAGKGAYIILDSAAGAGAAAFFWGNNPYVGIDIRNLGISMPTAGFGLIGIRIGQALYFNLDGLWIQGTGTTSDDQIGVQLDGLLPGGGFGYTGAGNIDRSLFANLLTGVNMIDDPTNGVIDGINIRGNSFQGSANHTSNRGLAYGRKAFACTFENNTVLGQWIGVDTLGTGLRQENNYYENDFPPAGVLAWRWVRGTGNTYIQNTALGEWRNALSYQAPNNGVDGCTIQTQNNLLFDNTFCEAALGFRELGRNFNAGRYTTPAFAAGNFTSNAGTWTVAGQTTYEYTIVGKKMTVAFFIVGTATGAGTELRIAIPQQTVYGSPVAVLAAQRTRNPIHVFQNATGAFGVAEVQVGDTFIRCFKDATAGGGSWTNGDCEVYGEITFEIQ